MNIRSVLVFLAMLALPISSFALEIHVALVDLPRQEANSNVARASIAARGSNLLPYTLVGGFEIHCGFAGVFQGIREQVSGNFWTGENIVFVPGPTPALGSWQMAGFETVGNGQCSVCTMTYKAIITNGLSVGYQGSGGTITFGGSGLEVLHTATFGMCKEPDDQCN
jgi:hypothetical protein